jgi:hypothetical protein
LNRACPVIRVHLGLYAEQTGASGEALGNFPQAFTLPGSAMRSIPSDAVSHSCYSPVP